MMLISQYAACRQQKPKHLHPFSNVKRQEHKKPNIYIPCLTSREATRTKKPTSAMAYGWLGAA